MAAWPRQMKIGLYATSTGGHVAGWRHPAAFADIGANIQAIAAMARLAEQGRFDFLFLADSLTMRGTDWEVLSRNSNRYVAQFEPLTLLSALSMATQHIGLIATSSTTYDEPYSLARKFASLDLLSGGRAGWNLVTSSNEEEAYNFSRAAHADHADRYDRASEFADVVLGLWDTWDADAFPRDKASGRFFDPTKLHLLNHAGRHFKVRGPLNVPRSPQGRPVVVQAGASEPGRDLAARTGEVVFSLLANIDAARAFYTDLKGRLARYGRDEEDLLILPGLNVFVAESREAARDKSEMVQSLVDPVVGRSFLSMMLGVDLSGYPDDGPLPALPPGNANKGMHGKVMEAARRENLTIRQVYMRMADKDTLTAVGTAADVADMMQERCEAGAADGFIFMPAFFPSGLEDFVRLVIPELQRRGVFRRDYEGTTLRQSLGLRVPRSRYGRQVAAE
jgi:FMN-dependent oxidoreductase (nitrilotriacetate monooxygenase family)